MKSRFEVSGNLWQKIDWMLHVRKTCWSFQRSLILFIFCSLNEIFNTQLWNLKPKIKNFLNKKSLWRISFNFHYLSGVTIVEHNRRYTTQLQLQLSSLNRFLRVGWIINFRSRLWWNFLVFLLLSLFKICRAIVQYIFQTTPHQNIAQKNQQNMPKTNTKHSKAVVFSEPPLSSNCP